jgi:S-adenosylmethionine:tRNA ribosyltransferase-isomerase
VKTELFDYALPEELIAAHPPEKRDGGRLLVLGSGPDEHAHRMVTDLPDLLPTGALLVVNDTKVIPASIEGRRPTGGRVDLLLVAIIESGETQCRCRMLGRANKPLRVGQTVHLGDLRAEITERDAEGTLTLDVFAPENELATLMETRGKVPLPPYLKRAPIPEDRTRYQTVYARLPGSVAAPTAGLHFTRGLMDALVRKGVGITTLTLHVGPGTFKPVRADHVEAHAMDREPYALSEPAVQAIAEAKQAGRPVIAVGTTTTRALEGAFADQGALKAGEGATQLFIKPGFSFQVIDGLIKNFHLPKSTLLCLVSALAGRERILAAYEEAIKLRYRFYSYGDAMLIWPKKI